MSVHVNFDNAIAHYNKNNPDKPELTREGLIKKLKTKCTINTIQNYKGASVPKAFKLLAEVLSVTGADVSDVLIIEKPKK